MAVQQNEVNINIIDNNQGLSVFNADGEVGAFFRSSTPIYKLNVQNNVPILIKSLDEAEKLNIKDIYSGKSYYFLASVLFSSLNTFTIGQSFSEVFYAFDSSNKLISQTVTYTLIAEDISISGSLVLSKLMPNLIKKIYATLSSDYLNYYETKVVGNQIVFKILDKYLYIYSLITAGQTDSPFFGALGKYNFSKDNGNIWNLSNLLNGGVLKIRNFNNKLYACSAGLLTSIDGVTWTTLNNSPANDVLVDGVRIYVVNNTGAFLSFNGGVTFSSAFSNQITGLNKIDKIGNITFVWRANLGVYYVNNGVMTQISTLPNTTDYGYMLNLGNKIIISGNNIVYQSIDNGLTWTILNNTLSVTFANFILFNNTIYGASSAGIYKSTDNGATWTIISGTATYNCLDIKEVQGYIFVGTSGSGVLRSIDGGNTFVSTTKNTGITGTISFLKNIIVCGDNNNGGASYSFISWFYDNSDTLLPFLTAEDYFIQSVYLKLKKYFNNNLNNQYIYLNVQWSPTAITECPAITLSDLINMNTLANSNLSLLHVSTNINGETDTVSNLKLYISSLNTLINSFETSEKSYLSLVLDSVLPLREATQIATWNDNINFNLSSLNSEKIIFIGTIDGSVNGDVANFLWNFLDISLLNYCAGLSQSGEALAFLVSNNITKNIGDHSIVTDRLDLDGVNNVNPALIFNLNAGATFGQFTYIDNTTFDYNSLIQRSIVCARKYSNNNGTFFQSDDTCTLQTSNFRQFSWVRTVNKGAKLCYNALQKRINAGLPEINSDGTLGFSGATFIKGIIVQEISTNMYPSGLNTPNAELRAEPIVTIDLKQKPLITKRLEVAVSFPIVGTTYTIIVNISNQL